MLEGLGMALPKDIGDHEFGITLSFGKELHYRKGPAAPANRSRLSFKGRAAIDGVDPAKFETQICVALAQAAPKLAAELGRARVRVPEGITFTHVLIVVPFPPGYSKQSDKPERTVATLSKAIRKEELKIGRHAVASVSLAMPQCIPREFNRNQLTRLALLGSGAFGEVHLYSVVEPHSRLPPYKVAVKTVKAGTSIGREELLKEAALMALMVHGNVLVR